MEVNMVKLQSETRLAEKNSSQSQTFCLNSEACLNIASYYLASYYLTCIIKYVLSRMCKGYRNADLVNAKGNDVALNHGYDNLA